MSELEPVEPEEAAEHLFATLTGPARAEVTAHADAEIAQPLDDDEELEELEELDELEEVEPVAMVAPKPKLAPPPPPPPPLPPPAPAVAAVRPKFVTPKPLAAAKPVEPVKPFKHPVPAKPAAATAAAKPADAIIPETRPIEKYYYLTGAQLVTMMITLPLMSAAISMGSMYLGHVITEESRVASQVLARIPRVQFAVPAPVAKPPAPNKPPVPMDTLPAVDVTTKPETSSVVAVPASAIEQTKLPVAAEDAPATAVFAVQAPVTANRFSAEVVPDSVLENIVPASAVTTEPPASPAPAEAPKVDPAPAPSPAARALVPVTARTASYLMPVDDAYYLLNATARDEAETVVPLAPPAPSTRAVEVDMPAATFEAPDEPQHYAEVLTPPMTPALETASAPKPPVTLTVVEIKPEPVAPPTSAQVAPVAPAKPDQPVQPAQTTPPLDETMRGEVLPRSDMEIAREKADDARRGKR